MGFGLGVLAGIIATIIAGIIWDPLKYLVFAHLPQFFIEKLVFRLPRLPRDRNLTGTWETEFEKDGIAHYETAIVSQLFGRVWGIIEYHKQYDSGRRLRKYRMTGSVRENILVATYDIVSPKQPLDRGSFTLEFLLGGTKLEGCYSWTDDSSREPKGDKYVWTRLDIRVKKSRIHGKGVFAEEEYQVGSEVAYFRGYEIDYDTRYSLTFEGHKIEPTGPLKYLNHSCDPNCCFRGRTLVTKRQVEQGEELTVDYSETEDGNKVSYPFKCNCGSGNCRKDIGVLVS